MNRIGLAEMSLVGATAGKDQTPTWTRATIALKPRPPSQINSISDHQGAGICRSTDRVTLGITAQSPPRALIDKGVYDLDVGSGHPNGAAAIKGSFVQRLKSYAI